MTNTRQVNTLPIETDPAEQDAAYVIAVNDDGSAAIRIPKTAMEGPAGPQGTVAVASEAEALAGADATKAMTPATNRDAATALNASWFGAVGDGTTDDAAALNLAAIAAGSGYEIKLDAKTYKVNSTVVVPPGAIFGGAGRTVGTPTAGRTIIRAAAGVTGIELEYGDGTGGQYLHDLIVYSERNWLPTTHLGQKSWTVATSDTFTSTAHGFVDTQAVILDDIYPATEATGVTNGVAYFVRDSTANTFALAATSGGAVIDITTTGAGFVAPVNCTIATDDVITKVAHGLSNGAQVMFHTLSGATGLLAGITYFVRDATTDTFKLAATSAGAAVNVTADGHGILNTFTDDGIRVHSPRCNLENVTAIRFGRHGINIESSSAWTSPAANCNVFSARSTATRVNGGNGVNIVGADSNICNFLSHDSATNGGYGVRNDAGHNTFRSLHLSGNGFGGRNGVLETGLSSNWLELYGEAGYETFDLAPGAGDVTLITSKTAAPMVLRLMAGASVGILNDCHIRNGNTQRTGFKLAPRALDGTGRLFNIYSSVNAANQFSIQGSLLDGTGTETILAAERASDSAYVRPGTNAAYDLGHASFRWRNSFHTGYTEIAEIALPAAPAADRARLFARDNGAGKTQLVVRFATGAEQVIATEP